MVVKEHYPYRLLGLAFPQVKEYVTQTLEELQNTINKGCVDNINHGTILQMSGPDPPNNHHQGIYEA
jgi:hypothetical protein